MSATATTGASSPVLAKSRILLVDDEEDIVSVFANGLRKHGFEVDGFSDPRDALHNLQPRRYSLAILDVRMPHMNGYQLASELLKVDPHIKIGFMSAIEPPFAPSAGEEEKPLFYPLFFLKKPISMQKMLDQLRTFFAQ